MFSTYTILPSSVAASVTICPPDGHRISAIYCSPGHIVLGLHDRPIDTAGLPAEVVRQIREHFDKVFALPHVAGDSERSRYVDSLRPWTIEVEE